MERAIRESGFDQGYSSTGASPLVYVSGSPTSLTLGKRWDVRGGHAPPGAFGACKGAEEGNGGAGTRARLLGRVPEASLRSAIVYRLLCFLFGRRARFHRVASAARLRVSHSVACSD